MPFEQYRVFIWMDLKGSLLLDWTEVQKKTCELLPENKVVLKGSQQLIDDLKNFSMNEAK